MKIVICNWLSTEEGIIGGTESIADQLSKVLNAKIITFNKAREAIDQTIPKHYYRYACLDRASIISDYIKTYKEIEDFDVLIDSDFCSLFLNKDIPKIAISQNPYKSIAEKLMDMGIYKYNSYIEFGKSYNLFQKENFANSKAIVSVSRLMQDYTSNMGFKSHLIKHGIDTELFKPLNNKDDLREKYGIPKDKKVAIWVGKFHPIKWQLMPQLIKNFKDIFWILVFFSETDMPQPKASNVKIFTSVKREEMPELYNCADLFVLPSIMESFNLSAIEALACDIPVVVANTGVFTIWQGGEEFGGEYGTKISNFTFEDYKLGIDQVLKGIKENRYRSRQVILDNKYDLESFKNNWKTLISSFK